MHGVTDVVVLGGLVGDPIARKYPAESALINDDGILQVLDLEQQRSSASDFHFNLLELWNH